MHERREGRHRGRRVRRGRQSAFWLRLLGCFPTAEQLSPATSNQPSALKGQAPQLGSPSQPVGRFRAESAWPSRRCLSYQTSPGDHTWTIGRTGVQHFFLFFFPSTESKAENDINLLPQSHFLTGDDCDRRRKLQRQMNLFEASLWAACVWWCDGRRDGPNCAGRAFSTLSVLCKHNSACKDVEKCLVSGYELELRATSLGSCEG